MPNEIPSRYTDVICILRDTLVECDGRPLYKAQDFGLNTCYPSRSGRVELVMDYGNVHELVTPDGTIEPYGSHVCAGDPDEFLRKLTERLKLEVKTPQRDDSKTDYLAFQLRPSGPVYYVNHPSCL